MPGGLSDPTEFLLTDDFKPLQASIEKYKYHFDTFWPAMSTTLRTMTLDDWFVNILNVLNADWHERRQAGQQEQMTSILYFMSILFVVMTITILFIGVIYGMFTYRSVSERKPGEVGILSLRHAHWALYRSRLDCVHPIRVLAPPRGDRACARFLYSRRADISPTNRGDRGHDAG